MKNTVKKLFTQKELEKHINARLMRERKKNDELNVLKGIIDELMRNGTIDADSYAEAGDRLTAIFALIPDGNKEDTHEEESAVASSVTKGEYPEDDAAAEPGISALGEDIEGSETSDTAELPFETADAYDDGDDRANNAPEEKTPVSCDTRDETDIKAALAGLCTEFAKLLEKAVMGEQSEKDYASESVVQARRAASSTGFSARSACDASSAGFELTPSQRDIARRAGISYREYAELLRDIPEGKKTRRQYR